MPMVCGGPSVFFALNPFDVSQCLWTCLDLSILDLILWADVGPENIEDSDVLFQTPTIWVPSMFPGRTVDFLVRSPYLFI